MSVTVFQQHLSRVQSPAGPCWQYQIWLLGNMWAQTLMAMFGLNIKSSSDYKRDSCIHESIPRTCSDVCVLVNAEPSRDEKSEIHWDISHLKYFKGLSICIHVLKTIDAYNRSTFQSRKAALWLRNLSEFRFNHTIMWEGFRVSMMKVSSVPLNQKMCKLSKWQKHYYSLSCLLLITAVVACTYLFLSHPSNLPHCKDMAVQGCYGDYPSWQHGSPL